MNNHDNDDESTRPRQPLSSESLKARLFLTVACLWPLMLLALLASSAPDTTTIPGNTATAALNTTTASHLRLSVRNALDRVDIMGYGPTHPRVAVVIVGSDTQALVATVKSVITHTDLQRLFVVTVVVEGKASDAALEHELHAMEEGSIPHWHGTRADVHNSDGGDKNKEEQHEETEHGRKIHVIFNQEAIGVSASREDAVDFVHLLAQYHEQAGLKSPAEDLLLVLLEAGAQLQSHKWIAPVTQALIVPPPLLPRALEEDEGAADGTPAAVSLKMANAVVFPAQGMGQQGQRIALDLNLAPIDTQASVEELNGSSGDSWMSPAWDGVGLAMRLETYRNLPLPQAVGAASLQDDAWAANLDVAMALWLCADGMDVLAELQVARSPQVQTPAGLSPASASRFAAAWMEDVTSAKFFKAYHKIHTEVTALDWNLWHAHSDAVWRNSRPRCRSFAWYMATINVEMGAALLQQLSLINQDETSNEAAEQAAQEEVVQEEAAEARVDNAKPAQPADAKSDDGNSVAIPARREQQKPSKPLCDECLQIVQKAQTH